MLAAVVKPCLGMNAEIVTKIEHVISKHLKQKPNKKNNGKVEYRCRETLKKH